MKDKQSSKVIIHGLEALLLPLPGMSRNLHKSLLVNFDIGFIRLKKGLRVPFEDRGEGNDERVIGDVGLGPSLCYHDVLGNLGAGIAPLPHVELKL